MKLRNVRRKQARRYLQRMPLSVSYLVPWSVIKSIQEREIRRSRAQMRKDSNAMVEVKRPDGQP